MKENLSEYVASLSNGDINILYDIIEKKYRKFLKFFHIIRVYSEYVTELNYEFTDSDVLSIEIKFSKQVHLKEKKDLIAGIEESGYKVKSTVSGKKVKLVIEHKE